MSSKRYLCRELMAVAIFILTIIKETKISSFYVYVKKSRSQLALADFLANPLKLSVGNVFRVPSRFVAISFWIELINVRNVDEIVFGPFPFNLT